MFVRKRSSTQPELQMCIEVHKAAAAGKPEYDAPLPPLPPSLLVRRCMLLPFCVDFDKNATIMGHYRAPHQQQQQQRQQHLTPKSLNSRSIVRFQTSTND